MEDSHTSLYVTNICVVTCFDYAFRSNVCKHSKQISDKVFDYLVLNGEIFY